MLRINGYLIVGFTLILAACVELEGSHAVEQSQLPIVGGSLEPGYPGVVYLELKQDNDMYAGCSGTLISPRVILTAAHCLYNYEDGVYSRTVESKAYFGTTRDYNDPGFIEEIEGASSTYHSSWNPRNVDGGYDVGMILLSRESTVTPRQIATSAPSTGADLTIVGWGNTSYQVGSGDKRSVVTDLLAVENRLIWYGDEDENTCQGDSGGPSFATVGGSEKVVGITSFGWNYCKGVSGGTRVDYFSSWITNWVEANDVPAPPDVEILRPSAGATVGSYFNVQVDAVDDGDVERVEVWVNGVHQGDSTMAPYFVDVSGAAEGEATIEARAYDNVGYMGTASITVTVSNDCTDADDCPSGYSCEDGECVPTDGGIGDECSDNSDCISGLCGLVNDERYCSQFCNLEADDCPDGFYCAGGGGQAGCVRAADGGEGGGGCTVGGGPARTPFAALIVLGAALLVVRRRSRR